MTKQIDAYATPANNLTWTTTPYNGASQITSETRDNDAYASLPPAAGTTAYVPNGLNQYSAVGGSTLAYDANGNLITDPTATGGSKTYVYDVENRLVLSTQGGVTATLTYDPLGRLFQVVKGASDTRMFYDGDAMAVEYDSAGTILNRYVHGSNAAADDPLVWYSGSTLTNKRWLHADHLGSIVAATDASGGNPSINRYDEYGVPASTNAGRFQYTGQVWLPEVGLYYYKGRMYDPRSGRFNQTDPVGYEGGINLYAYVEGDPVNGTDFTGDCPVGTKCEDTSGLQGMEGSRSDGTRIPQVTQTPLQNGSIQVDRSRNGAAAGSIILQPQGTAGGAPAQVTSKIQNRLLNFSESIGSSINVTSGIRTPGQNLNVEHPYRDSQHLPQFGGNAADINIAGWNSHQTAMAAYRSRQFNRSIEYVLPAYRGGPVPPLDAHVDLKATGNQGLFIQHADDGLAYHVPGTD